jgi:hypothetical protein
MPVVAFRSGHAMPLGAVLSCAVALSAPQRARLFLMTLVAVGGIASTLPAIMQRFRPARRVVVRPPSDDAPPPAAIAITTGTRTRTFGEAIVAGATKAEDAADLVRMDDDGGFQMASPSAREEQSFPNVRHQ